MICSHGNFFSVFNRAAALLVFVCCDWIIVYLKIEKPGGLIFIQNRAAGLVNGRFGFQTVRVEFLGQRAESLFGFFNPV